MKARGFSLLEVVMALSLLAFMLPLLLNLVPSSRLASHRAEQVQTATGAAVQWLEEARAKPRPRQENLVINRVSYPARTEIFPVSGTSLADVVVTVETPRGAPIVLSTRISVSDS